MGWSVGNERYNSIGGDQWSQQMEKREEREKARGGLLYLEEP